jgi:hypothetical protein
MPQGERARPLRRLQNEMQMLLYTHPVNDSRAERGLTTVNAFWLSGTGSLPPNIPRKPTATLLLAELRDSALRDDAWTWAQAWAALDAAHGARWLARAQEDAAFCISLCGSQQAHSYTAQAARTQSWLARARQAWSPTSFPERLRLL